MLPIDTKQYDEKSELKKKGFSLKKSLNTYVCFVKNTIKHRQQYY